MPPNRGAAMVDELGDRKMQLQVRPGLIVRTAYKAPRFGEVGRQNPGAMPAPFGDAFGNPSDCGQ